MSLMRLMIAALCLFPTMTIAFDFRFPVTEMTAHERDDTWNLTSDKQYAQITLDCMSFLNELQFYQWDSQGELELKESLFLYHDECHAIAERIYQDVNLGGKPQCLQIQKSPLWVDFSELGQDCTLDQRK